MKKIIYQSPDRASRILKQDADALQGRPMSTIKRAAAMRATI